MRKISLSYTETKLIRERVEHALNLERKKAAQAPPITDELMKAQEKFIEIQKENIAKIEQLVELKKQELELLKEVAEQIVSSTQLKQVKGILEEAKIVLLKTDNLNQIIVESETNKSRNARKAITEISGYIDILQKKKNAK